VVPAKRALCSAHGLSLVSIRGDENGGVADDGAHAGRRTVLLFHRSTVAKPARRRIAWRAAIVIQPDTARSRRRASTGSVMR